MSMLIVNWKEFLDKPVESALSIGVFDGIHIGHQELIKCIIDEGPNPTVISFTKNPKKVFDPAQFRGDIYTIRQKIDIFQKMGLSRLVLIDFSLDFGKMRGRDFVDLLNNPGKMVFMAVGSNFRCGYKQDTGVDFIQEYINNKGIPVRVLPPVIFMGEPVSSSRIRNAIHLGALEEAAVLMGRNVQIDLRGIIAEPCAIAQADAQAYSYDLLSAGIITPADGSYNVLMYAEGEDEPPKNAVIIIEKGKLVLPEKADTLEFI